jgi:menaquinone-dependent protoporphyrinogen oxidase
MAKILLLYSSVYGHTLRICERMGVKLTSLGHEVELVPLAEGGADPARYDAVLIGASIRNGKHNPAVMDFITRHKALLDAKPSGFFSVNLVARKPHKNTPETNPYTKAFVAKSPWQPKLLGVFGGDLDYQRYTAFDRNVIRFIMWLTKGPTDAQTKDEYTNWDEVERFAERFAALAAEPPAEAEVSTLTGRLGRHQHLLLALLSAWLILTSPWVHMFRQIPGNAGFLDYSHIVLGLVASLLAITFTISCTRLGRWRLYFPWLSGELGQVARDLRGLLHREVPTAEGGGLFALLEGCCCWPCSRPR